MRRLSQLPKRIIKLQRKKKIQLFLKYFVNYLGSFKCYTKVLFGHKRQKTVNSTAFKIFFQLLVSFSLGAKIAYLAKIGVGGGTLCYTWFECIFG